MSRSVVLIFFCITLAVACPPGQAFMGPSLGGRCMPGLGAVAIGIECCFTKTAKCPGGREPVGNVSEDGTCTAPAVVKGRYCCVYPNWPPQ